MNLRLLFPAFFFIFSTCQPSEKSPKTTLDDRPNILLIMADDMGFSDLGFFGSQIATPTLDQLANNGLVMTRFYNTGRCCPSRAALLTGLYQHQTGVGDMTRDLGDPHYQGFLNRQCATLAELLADGGYQTYMSGKWHLGSDPAYWPSKRGFQRFFGIPEGGGVYYYPFRKTRQVILDGQPASVDTATFYTTHAFNEYAHRFLSEHFAQPTEERSPFFLYLPHIAPHFPIQAPEEKTRKYRGKFKQGFTPLRERRLEAMKRKGLLPDNITLSPSDDAVLDWESLTEAQKDTFDLRMSIFAAQMEIMDEGIGQIINLLKEKGALDNTLILFLSDNGGTHEYLELEEPPFDGDLGSRHSYSSYRRSWANVSNTPFRLYKHWVHEGGISTPLIAHFPQQIKQARIDHTTVGHIMDIVPTCLEIAEINYPRQFNGNPLLPLEGKSLKSVFSQKSDTSDRLLFWEHEGNRAVRQGDWKLVSSYPKNQWELYNLKEDPVEMNDLANTQEEKVQEMEALYENWAKRVGVRTWGELNPYGK